ncbi:MAG: hypothetical protein WCP39_07550 [Chlamydiota bacterium]
MLKKIVIFFLLLSSISSPSFAKDKEINHKVGAAAKESTFNAVAASMVICGVLMVAGIIVACTLAKTSSGTHTH